MPEVKRLRDINIEPPTFMETKSLASSLYALQTRIADYARGFVFSSHIHYYPLKGEWNGSVKEVVDIFNITRTFYTPLKDYKEYLILKSSEDASFDNKINYSEMALWAIKIIKHQEHELGDIDKRILKSIKNAEKIRKAGC